MADVCQLVPFVYTQDKGTEMSSAPSRFCESCDHGLLREVRLHLQPLSAPSARFVHALRMFGDDPFKSFFFGGVVKQDAFLPYVIAESYFWDGRENLFQKLLPPEQRQARQVMPPEVEEIENVVEQMTAS